MSINETPHVEETLKPEQGNNMDNSSDCCAAFDSSESTASTERSATRHMTISDNLFNMILYV